METMEKTITPAILKHLLSKETPLQLLDVRRAEDLEKDPAGIPGAVWHDPGTLEQWSASLEPEPEIILYCVRGGSVSETVLEHLHSKGLNARFIEGGLEAWKAAGGDITTSDQQV